MKATNQAQVPSTAEQQATDTKPKAAKSEKQMKPTKATKATKAVPKASVPSQESSMAAFMDALVQKTTDPKALESALAVEAKKRGIKAPTIGALRSHVKYRQARGQLQGVTLPEATN